MDDDKRCEFTGENGERCRAWKLTGKSFCFSHDPSPEIKQAKLEACRTGGLVKAVEINTPLERVEIASPKDVVALIIKVIGEVRSGAIDPKIGGTLGYLATCLLKSYEVAKTDVDEQQIDHGFKSGASDVALIHSMEPADREEFIRIARKYTKAREVLV